MIDSRKLVGIVGFLVTAGLFATRPATAQTSLFDDFESYMPGTFPAPPWSDVGLLDGGSAPNPSARIVATTDAFGAPTQVLSVADALAPSQGIYRSVTVRPTYYLAADVRVDRFSDTSNRPDWAMQVGFAKVTSTNIAFSPQLGIYVDCHPALQGWRLYQLEGSVFNDIDLNVFAQAGVWYRVELSLVAATGEVRSRITDIASGALLRDQTDLLSGWDPSFGQYDSIAFFEGELAQDETVANQSVIDNIQFGLGASAAPEPHTLLLLIGFLPGVVCMRIRRRRRSGQVAGPEAKTGTAQ